MFNVSFIYRERTVIGGGILQYLPRIGEKIIMNSKAYVIKDIIYELKGGTTSAVDVFVYVDG